MCRKCNPLHEWHRGEAKVGPVLPADRPVQGEEPTYTQAEGGICLNDGNAEIFSVDSDRSVHVRRPAL
jgi:hypothetical protein